MKRSISIAAALLAAAACGKSQEAPWLTYPGYDAHAFFPLKLSAHEGLVCEDCHVNGVTGPTTFKQFTCTGCHLGTHSRANTDSWHTTAGVADYVWDTPTCFKCHPLGRANTKHHLFFPVGEGTKHNRVCSECHLPDLVTRKDPATLKCIGCHTDPARFPAPSLAQRHALVTDYPAATALGPKDCLRCHDNGQVDRLATHGRKPGPAGYGPAGPWDGVVGTDGGHGVANQRARCFSCHDAPPPPPYSTGAGPGLPNRPWAQDWKIPATTSAHPKGACGGCHGPQL